MNSIDVVMATHNGEQYVAEQIESLLWQSFENWHLYISDDSSEDRTLDIIREYARKEPRITVVSEGVRFGSAKANFMNLLKYSNAPYTMFCDQDDVWLPDKIQKTIECMHGLEAERDRSIPLLVFSDMAVVDEDLQIIAPSLTRLYKLHPEHSELNQVIVRPIGVGCTFMMNRALVCVSLEHADVCGMCMHDWWVTSCAAAFGRISYIDEPLSLYRQHLDDIFGDRIFSMESRVAQAEHMNAFLRNVKQAYAFRNAYVEMLSHKDLSCLDSFINAASSEMRQDGVQLTRQGELLEGMDALNGFENVYGMIPTPSKRIACGIVTYEPDIERLHDNIRSIATQVSCIYIYDNGSSNVNEAMSCLEEIQHVSIVMMRSKKNDGLSIALNILSMMALSDGFEYILLLDQDSAATEHMVSNLASLTGKRCAIVCPLLADRNNEYSVPNYGFVRFVKRTATSGCLLYLPAFVDVGGYDERLFVDWVDFEFCDNLRHRGWKILQTSSAVLIHEVGHQEPVFRGPGRDGEGINRISRMYYRTNHPVWRVEDRARSQIITMKKYFGTRIFLEELYLFVRMTVARTLLLEKNKGKLTKAIYLGVYRGLTNK